MKKETSILIPFLMLCIVALISGLWAGLLRLGWAIPSFTAALPMQHGPLMISGFLGALIILERVAALRQRWMFAAPLLSSAGWILSLAIPGHLIGPLLITLASLVGTAVLGVIVRREAKIYTAVMAVGAACWLGGNLLWILGNPIPLVVWWWAAFLVLTITGERLELNRVIRLTSGHYLTFTISAAIFLLGAVLYTLQPETGARTAGIGMLMLSAWLIRFDIARRNLRHPAALTRFIAFCLFSGYLWLGMSGIFNLLFGAQYAGPIYDAVLHSVFIGFVFSMIFGHAPIILPALTRINVPFHPGFYLPLILLHASLILRIVSDLTFQPSGRLWGGIINEIAILAYFGLVVTSVIRQRAGRPVSEKPQISRTEAGRDASSGANG